MENYHIFKTIITENNMIDDIDLFFTDMDGFIDGATNNLENNMIDDIDHNVFMVDNELF